MENAPLTVSNSSCCTGVCRNLKLKLRGPQTRRVLDASQTRDNCQASMRPVYLGTDRLFIRTQVRTYIKVEVCKDCFTRDFDPNLLEFKISRS